MSFKVIAISPALGAEIRGIDLSQPLGDSVRRELQSLWAEKLVLVFRRQTISDPQLLAFTRQFGDLDPPGPNPYGEPFHKTHPEINVISNIVENGIPRGNLGAGEAVWHADMTYLDYPPKAGILYSLEIPPQGGDTYFANMYAAYEALDKNLQEQIKDKIAIHDASHNSAGMLRKGYQSVSDVRQIPGARHPLVRTDPATGRKALFLGRRPRSYILGMEVADSEALLDTLWQHATRTQFAMQHVWAVGDVLMWDNLSVLHRRDAFDTRARRRMHRTQLKGEAAIH